MTVNVISLIVDSLVQASSGMERHKRSVLEFEGVGTHAREQREPQRVIEADQAALSRKCRSGS